MNHPVPTAAVLQHLAIVGRTGSGKTYCAKGLVEQLLEAGRRVIVLDPTAAWWGLRSRADGSPGLPVAIVGGEHGDAPLQAEQAEVLAAWLVERNASAVIDLSEMLIGERHRFVTDFADHLYRLNRSPLHLVVDEADEFMPQNPLPETRRMLHHMDRIVRRGRIRGFRVMMVTQRPAVLHKNVLSQANTLIALRLTAPQDRKAIEAWVEGNADAGQARRVMASLASLQRGEGWVWAPELGVLERAKFPTIRTFDSSRSPEDGESYHEPEGLRAVDFSELARHLAASEEAPAKKPAASDAVAIAREAIEEAEQRGYDRGHAAGMDAGRNEGFRAARNVFESNLGALRRQIDEAVAWIQAVTEPQDEDAKSAAEYAEPMRPAPQASVSVSRVAKSTDRAASSSPTIGSGGKRRMLTALAQHPDGLTTRRLSLLIDMSPKGGTWRTYLGELRGAGYVEGSADLLRITAAGRKALGPFDPLPTGAALREYWRTRLGDSGKRAIFDVLVRAYPRSLPAELVSRETGMAIGGGTWRTYLGELRGLGLVEGSGQLKASKELFA